LLFCCFIKFICIFELFQELTASVRSCSCRAHTNGIVHAGLSVFARDSGSYKKSV
jgi:hypothetical protein